MSVSRRKLYGLKASVAYLVFATAWILFSDSLLEQFSDPSTLTRYGMFKGLAFVVATSAILWFTLMNAPADADVDLRGASAWEPQLVMEVLVARLAALSR